MSLVELIFPPPSLARQVSLWETDFGLLPLQDEPGIKSVKSTGRRVGGVQIFHNTVFGSSPSRTIMRMDLVGSS